MRTRGRRGGERLAPATVAGLLALVLLADGMVVLARSYAAPPAAPSAAASAVAGRTPGAVASAAVVGRGPGALVRRDVAAPADGVLRLAVPALDVDAAASRLATAQDGTLEVPGTADAVGWYAAGPVPGDVGPAVFAGHVDLDGRRGVFADLARLRPGEQVSVVRPDGRTVTFVVDRVEQHAKDAFPTEAVYGPTDVPQLRLVTCGGAYDRRRGSYRDNVVVFASLARLRGPA